jgi:hypothetical protein
MRRAQRHASLSEGLLVRWWHSAWPLHQALCHRWIGMRARVRLWCPAGPAPSSPPHTRSRTRAGRPARQHGAPQPARGAPSGLQACGAGRPLLHALPLRGGAAGAGGGGGRVRRRGALAQPGGRPGVEGGGALAGVLGHTRWARVRVRQPGSGCWTEAAGLQVAGRWRSGMPAMAGTGASGTGAGTGALGAGLGVGPQPTTLPLSRQPSSGFSIAPPPSSSTPATWRVGAPHPHTPIHPAPAMPTRQPCTPAHPPRRPPACPAPAVGPALPRPHPHGRHPGAVAGRHAAARPQPAATAHARPQPPPQHQPARHGGRRQR